MTGVTFAGDSNGTQFMVDESINWEQRFNDLCRAIEAIPDDFGIYPMAVKGHSAEHDYKQRDGFKNGWNAAVMQFTQNYLKAVGQAKEGMDDNLATLLAADVGYMHKGTLHLNMNDTWAWACADSEPVPADKLEEVADLFQRWGHAGLLYWTSKQRGGERSEFKDINRFIDFVAREERWREKEPSSSKRAYTDIPETV